MSSNKFMTIKDVLISVLSRMTNLGSSRYVKEFSRQPLKLEAGRTQLCGEAEEKASELVKQCSNLVDSASEIYPVLKEIEETIFLSIIDLNDLRFTVKINKGKVKASLGWEIGSRPTLVVPLFLVNLENLKNILSDKSVDKKELYRIARVLFVSFIRGLYDANFLYTPGDKRYLKLDNIMHVEMLEMPMVMVDGFPGTAKATVLNINGEWLVFEGWQGTPRVKITCNLDQALQYYYILMVEMKKANTVAKMQKAFEKYMKLRTETCEDVYKK